MTAVAVIGTGRMGAAMTGRLTGAGHNVVAYNRSRERAERLGVALAETPRVAAAAAEVVFVSLADDAALDAVYRGADGLAAGLSQGAIVLETSTVHPATVRRLAPLVMRHGATLLDAPVSGSVPVVERGELTFMVGGEAAALERVRPLLDTMAKHVFHLGDVGAGATMKLVVNGIIGALNAALCEALVLAEKAGLRRDTVYDVIASSAAAAPYVHYKRAAFEHPDDTPVAFSIDLVAKDMALIDDLAADVGARMTQLAAVRAVVAEAVRAGYGSRDMSAIAELLRR